MRYGVNARTITGMELTEWLAGITDDTAQNIAARAGLPKRTVQHQLSTGRMSLENLVKIAAAYGHHPLRTLIEWEIVDRAWEKVPDVKAALRLASEDDLSDEVVRRLMELKEAKRTSSLDTPIDELAAKRSTATTPNVSPSTHDGTVTDWDDSQPFAADSSPDEGGSPDDYIP